MTANKKSKKTTLAGPGDTPAVPPASLIVAIGASSAHSHPVEQFLQGLPLENGITVVLAFQNREALDEERFRQGLAKHGRELTLAIDGTSVETGRIYWAAPNMILTMEDGRFRCRKAEEEPGERGTIDSFFWSRPPRTRRTRPSASSSPGRVATAFSGSRRSRKPAA